MLPSTGWHRIEIGDLHFYWGFLAWEGWLLELLNASFEVVFGGLLGKDLGGSSSENRKSTASPVHDWTYKGVMGYFSGRPQCSMRRTTELLPACVLLLDS